MKKPTESLLVRSRSLRRLAAIAALGLGCASYRGTASTVQPSEVAREGGWVIVPHFPLVMQQGDHDCGAAALAAVLTYWGHPANPGEIVQAQPKPGQRLSASDIERYARAQGLSSYVFFGTMKDVAYELGHGRPVIVGVAKPYSGNKAVAHYEVVVGYDPAKKRVLFLDPGRGWQTDSFEGFGREWAVSKGVTIVAFLRASSDGASSG